MDFIKNIFFESNDNSHDLNKDLNKDTLIDPKQDLDTDKIDDEKNKKMLNVYNKLQDITLDNIGIDSVHTNEEKEFLQKLNNIDYKSNKNFILNMFNDLFFKSRIRKDITSIMKYLPKLIKSIFEEETYGKFYYKKELADSINYLQYINDSELISWLITYSSMEYFRKKIQNCIESNINLTSDMFMKRDSKLHKYDDGSEIGNSLNGLLKTYGVTVYEDFTDYINFIKSHIKDNNALQVISATYVNNIFGSFLESNPSQNQKNFVSILIHNIKPNTLKEIINELQLDGYDVDSLFSIMDDEYRNIYFSNALKNTTNFNAFDKNENELTLFDEYIISNQDVKQLDNYKRFYEHPKKEANRYNNQMQGYFFHVTNVNSVQRLIETSLNKKNTSELCVSTFDSESHFTGKEKVIVVGKGNLRLLFDFDCYSAVDNDGYRYAKLDGVEYSAVDIDEPNKDKRIKKQFEKIGEYYDEGFIKPKDAEFFMLLEFNETPGKVIEELCIKYNLEYMNAKTFIDLLKGDFFKFYLKIDNIYRMTHNQKDDIDDEDYYKVAEKTILSVFNEDVYKSGNGYDLDRAYELVNSTYTKSIGGSWDKEKFIRKAKEWDFYGDENGFIAVREQKSGLLKFVAGAGSDISKDKGMKEILSLNRPLWGAAPDKLVRFMSRKYGFIIIPNIIVKYVFEKLVSSNNLPGKLNDDGTIRFDGPNGGVVDKRLFCNKQYIEWMLENNKDIPDSLKVILKGLLGFKNLLGLGENTINQKPFSVDITKLVTPNWKLEDTIKDIKENRPSKTEGPITVSKLGNAFFVINGNHRAVEAVIRGDTKIVAVLDEFVPNMEKTGQSYVDMIKSSVNISDYLKPKISH